jgi:mucin-19
VSGGASQTGINYSVVIVSTAGNVTLNGGTTDGLGIHNSATSTITANNITLNGTATLAPNWVTHIGAMTI